MSRRRSPEVSPVRVAEDSGGPARFAWQVHMAQEGWTSKVDTKGSILLALQGGALFAVLSASGKDGVFARLDGWRRVLEITGVAALVLAMVAAGLAVFPRLGSARRQRGEFRDELIYFGHLRHWSAEALHTRLRHVGPEDELAALAGQLTRGSRSNWVKYRLVQLSLTLALVGIVAVGVAALLP